MYRYVKDTDDSYIYDLYGIIYNYNDKSYIFIGKNKDQWLKYDYESVESIKLDESGLKKNFLLFYKKRLNQNEKV